MSGAVLSSSPSGPRPADCRLLLQELLREAPLYAILDRSLEYPLAPLEAAAAWLRAGVRVIQYRHKRKFTRADFEFCRALAGQIHSAGGILIVNDRADVAALTGADGVHLGQTDLPAEKARSFLGPEAIIGWSTHNARQAALAESLPVDYIAIGPVFPTMTKKNPDPVVGLAAVSEARRITSRPLVAIGGITIANAAAVIEAGADGVAVAGDLLRGGDLEGRAGSFLKL